MQKINDRESEFSQKKKDICTLENGMKINFMVSLSTSGIIISSSRIIVAPSRMILAQTASGGSTKMTRKRVTLLMKRVMEQADFFSTRMVISTVTGFKHGVLENIAGSSKMA